MRACGAACSGRCVCDARRTRTRPISLLSRCCTMILREDPPSCRRPAAVRSCDLRPSAVNACQCNGGVVSASAKCRDTRVQADCILWLDRRSGKESFDSGSIKRLRFVWWQLLRYAMRTIALLPAALLALDTTVGDASAWDLSESEVDDMTMEEDR